MIGTQLQFDTLDKKPKVWNVLILSVAVLALAAAALWRWGVAALVPLDIVTVLYCAAVIAMLCSAFFRQLRYNPYSYNTILYSGFAIFTLFVLCAHVYALTGSAMSEQTADARRLLQPHQTAQLDFPQHGQHDGGLVGGKGLAGLAAKGQHLLPEGPGLLQRIQGVLQGGFAAVVQQRRHAQGGVSGGQMGQGLEAADPRQRREIRQCGEHHVGKFPQGGHRAGLRGGPDQFGSDALPADQMQPILNTLKDTGAQLVTDLGPAIVTVLGAISDGVSALNTWWS